jgi:hypothetical protein
LQDLSPSSPPSPAPGITNAPTLGAPALRSAIAPPQPPSPTQPSGSPPTRVAGTTSSVVQTPRKTPFKIIPWWSAFRNEPWQISGGSSGAPGLAVETESDSESDGDVAEATMQHPVLLIDEHSDAADEVCRVAHSTSLPRTEDITIRRPTFEVAPHLSTDNADSFEIPESPSAIQKTWRPVDPSMLRVVDKRLDARRPQYLVLCWIHPPESEAANSDLGRHFRKYDEKISRDLARQERLSTLRSRKHFTDGRQSPDRSQKRQRTHATASTSQNRAYPLTK